MKYISGGHVRFLIIAFAFLLNGITSASDIVTFSFAVDQSSLISKSSSYYIHPGQFWQDTYSTSTKLRLRCDNYNKIWYQPHPTKFNKLVLWSDSPWNGEPNVNGSSAEIEDYQNASGNTLCNQVFPKKRILDTKGLPSKNTPFVEATNVGYHYSQYLEHIDPNNDPINAELIKQINSIVMGGTLGNQNNDEKGMFYYFDSTTMSEYGKYDMPGNGIWYNVGLKTTNEEDGTFDKNIIGGGANSGIPKAMNNAGSYIHGRVRMRMPEIEFHENSQRNSNNNKYDSKASMHVVVKVIFWVWAPESENPGSHPNGSGEYQKMVLSIDVYRNGMTYRKEINNQFESTANWVSHDGHTAGMHTFFQDSQWGPTEEQVYFIENLFDEGMPMDPWGTLGMVSTDKTFKFKIGKTEMDKMIQAYNEFSANNPQYGINFVMGPGCPEQVCGENSEYNSSMLFGGGTLFTEVAGLNENNYDYVKFKQEVTMVHFQLFDPQPQ